MGRGFLLFLQVVSVSLLLPCPSPNLSPCKEDKWKIYCKCFCRHQHSNPRKMHTSKMKLLLRSSRNISIFCILQLVVIQLNGRAIQCNLKQWPAAASLLSWILQSSCFPGVGGEEVSTCFSNLSYQHVPIQNVRKSN